MENNLLAYSHASLSSFPLCVADGCMEKPGLQGLHSLQVLMPSLLRHEVEMALEKLDLIWDRAYAWDMFLDMMVRCHEQHYRS